MTPCDFHTERIDMDKHGMRVGEQFVRTKQQNTKTTN